MSSHVSLSLSFAFGIIFVAAILALVVEFPHPSAEQFQIFRIVIAVAVSGVAAIIPGILKLKMKWGSGLALRAGGALAVFVVVYFYNPAAMAAQGGDSYTINGPNNGHQGPAHDVTIYQAPQPPPPKPEWTTASLVVPGCGTSGCYQNFLVCNTSPNGMKPTGAIQAEYDSFGGAWGRWVSGPQITGSQVCRVFEQHSHNVARTVSFQFLSVPTPG